MESRRKIVINASTVLISGGLYLTQSIIRTVIEDDSFEVIIICPNYRKYSSFDTANSSLFVVPKWQLYRIFRLYLDYFWLPSQIRKTNPDLVFSFTNIPARTSVKQIYLHDNPYFLSESLPTIKLSIRDQVLQKLRSYFTRERLKYADLIIVQSEYFAKKLLEQLGSSANIKILTPLVPEMSDSVFEKDYFKGANNRFKILCLSRYFKHKNIEILVKTARLVKELNLPYLFFITIEKNQHKEAGMILSEIRNARLEDTIINLGRLNSSDTGNYITSCDAMILPSLLESFSLNFIEAWVYQKPLFVSETEANRIACKDAAFYFDPKNEMGILKSLSQLTHPDKINEMIHRGTRRVESLSTKKDYIDLINTF